MARHVNRREPRAHWVLLLLLMLALLVELSLNGFVHKVGAEGSGPQLAVPNPGWRRPR